MEWMDLMRVLRLGFEEVGVYISSSYAHFLRGRCFFSSRYIHPVRCLQHLAKQQWNEEFGWTIVVVVLGSWVL